MGRDIQGHLHNLSQTDRDSRPWDLIFSVNVVSRESKGSGHRHPVFGNLKIFNRDHVGINLSRYNEVKSILSSRVYSNKYGLDQEDLGGSVQQETSSSVVIPSQPPQSQQQPLNTPDLSTGLQLHRPAPQALHRLQLHRLQLRRLQLHRL